MSNPDAKSQLRARLRAMRSALSPTEVQTRSAAVHANLLLQPEFWAAPMLLTYVSIDNEVDTRALITSALAEGRRVAVPRLGTPGAMDWVEISSLESLTEGKYGIPEPVRTLPATRVSRDSIVLVPGVAFSPSGHRIGFGGGYFDRFLSEFGGVSIGLAYDFLVMDSLPTAPHDRRVVILVSETSAYRADALSS
ncbi:MAG: 5-formyltetrahydrofolate cyclo-ligase [Candidatus Hydrogenedentes bacterium]|nr:5-formyltetrahydrofolate cyclo-ligase [Candidatus Hydrogenedentota bacterium]